MDLLDNNNAMILSKLKTANKEFNVGSIGHRLFIFYLLIASGVVFQMFNCELRRFLETNTFMIHSVAIMFLYFFVVLADSVENKQNETNPFLILGWTAGLYLVFLISTHCQFQMFAAALLLLFALFVLQNIKTYTMQKQSESNFHSNITQAIENTQVVLQVAAATSIVFGFLVFTGEQAFKYDDKNWSWIKFWLETPCKGTGSFGRMLLKKYKMSGLAIKGIARFLKFT